MIKRKVASISELPGANAYLTRVGAEVRSMRTAVVKEMHGKYWHDLAVIRFSRVGEILAPTEYAPTEAEAKLIATEFVDIEFPRLMSLTTPLLHPGLPDIVKQAQRDNIFEFHDMENRVVMLQVRIMRGEQRHYLPFTFWSDEEWRQMEPEGPLPLWGLDQLAENSTVFVHEGAKAARYIRGMIAARTPAAAELLSNHPWGQELCNAAHLGWIGGAMSPLRTDWTALQKAGVRRVYVVSDNDQPGVQAVPAIAQMIRIPTFHVMFTNEWPISFDLADEFPRRMFSEIDGTKRYIGPPFRACLHPATWATELRAPPGGKGRPIATLRESFKDLWAYIEEADLFVCKEMPEMLRTEQVLNKITAPFSHVHETSKLIVKAFRGRTTKLCYRPDMAGRVITDKGTSAVNLHVPSDIRSSAGDPSLFLDFVGYLFPMERERAQILRWCATLIAKPEVRMHYGLLLVTENQGIGKTTLASAILSPLVGINNTGWPTESDVATSDFNGWLANKRLVVVNEIYSGHSWKAYNKLKSIITDTDVNVNQKHQRTYTIENWAHVIACSNSLRALRMEEDDRRWFYPQVTEHAWGRHKFTELRNWLSAGGLSIVRWWAEQYGEYVQAGERPMNTLRKKELINGSRSEGAAEAATLGEALAMTSNSIVLTMKDIVAHVRSTVQGRVYESDYELRKAMVDAGCRMWPERIKINGQLQYVVMTKEAYEEIEVILENREITDRIRAYVKRPSEIMEGSM